MEDNKVKLNEMAEGGPSENHKGQDRASYVSAALKVAQYKYLPNDEMFYGEIPGLKGVYGMGTTKEECERDLEEALEGWLEVRQSLGRAIPEIEGTKLTA